MSEEIRLDSLRVLALQVANGASRTAHTSWRVDYAPIVEEDGSGRVVFGTLHVASEQTFGYVTVGALLTGSAALSGDDIEEALRASDDVDALYFLAAATLRSAAGLVDERLSIATAVPEPIIGQLERPSDGNTLRAVE